MFIVCYLMIVLLTSLEILQLQEMLWISSTLKVKMPFEGP